MTGRRRTVTAKQVVAILIKAHFSIKRQIGSHVHLFHPITHRRTTVAMHPGDLPRPLVKEIIRQAGLTEQEFFELL